MARISQDQAQERHAFLLDLFRNQPDISRNEAMDAYKDKFGASLNAKTFNELREQALREAESAEKEEESVNEVEETPVEETKQRVVAAAPALSERCGGAGGGEEAEGEGRGGEERVRGRDAGAAAVPGAGARAVAGFGARTTCASTTPRTAGWS